MSKQGMARPDRTHTHPKNDLPPVPELQGKAKHSKVAARPIVAGTSGPDLKVWHDRKNGSTPAAPISRQEDPAVSAAYSVFDNDLARDNLENDIPEADLEDL